MFWRVANVLTRQLIGTLRVSDYSVSDPVTGAGSGTVTLPLPIFDALTLARLRQTLTVPDQVALALDDGTGVIVWCGIVRQRPWKRRDGQLQLSVDELTQWLYDVRLRVGAMNVDANGDYLRTGVEQAQLYADLVTAGTTKSTGVREPGALTIDVPAVVSTGVLRDLTARRGDSIGETLDNLSKRDGALEWWIETRLDDAGNPRALTWTFRTASERSSRSTTIRLQSTPSAANVDYESWPQDYSKRRPRIEAKGDGNPPDQLYAIDEDPQLANDVVLLREQSSGPYSGVTNVLTLFDHARAERLAREDAVGSVQLTVNHRDVPIGTYTSGDRVQLRIVDEWLDVNLPAARIIDRTISGGASKPEQCVLTVNVSDYEMPDTSAGEV